MVNLEQESLVAIRDVPAAIQRLTGEKKRRHISCSWRWIQRGCRGVKLESILIGGRRYVTEESLVRFIQATTAAADGNSATTEASDGNSATPSILPSARKRAIQAANAELTADGI